MKDLEIVYEGPIITDHINLTVKDSFFLREDCGEIGTSTPMMEVVPRFSPDGKSVRFHSKLTVCGKSDKDDEMYTLIYSTRTTYTFNKEVTSEFLDDSTFDELTDPIYQRMADRVFHIGLDMGIVFQMPIRKGRHSLRLSQK